MSDPANENPSPTENDAPGNGGNPEQATLESVFKSAAGGGAAPAPAPARKPGQRGPDKNPGGRKKARVPLATLVDGPGPALLTENGRVPLPVDFEPVAPAVDDAALRVGIEGVVRILEGATGLYLSQCAKSSGVSREVAAAAIESSKPSGDVRACLVHGGVETWKKYFPNVPIGPETELLGAMILWGKQVLDAAQVIKEAGHKLEGAPA